jgi:hypothetical protein
MQMVVCLIKPERQYGQDFKTLQMLLSVPTVGLHCFYACCTMHAVHACMHENIPGELHT